MAWFLSRVRITAVLGIDVLEARGVGTIRARCFAALAPPVRPLSDPAHDAAPSA